MGAQRVDGHGLWEEQLMLKLDLVQELEMDPKSGEELVCYLIPVLRVENRNQAEEVGQGLEPLPSNSCVLDTAIRANLRVQPQLEQREHCW